MAREQKMLSFQVPKEDYEELLEFLKTSDLSLSQFMRRALKFYLQFELGQDN